MAQRVRIPHRGQSPSSVTQLPILTALHARCPTLFDHIIHELTEKVKCFLQGFGTFLRQKQIGNDGITEQKAPCRQMPAPVIGLHRKILLFIR